jgi:molybdopterin molybdotransferase
MASLKAIGCAAELFHLPDDKNILEEQLAAIIQNHEVIILSGGVSKGKFDFVPHALKAIGIQQHFHQVAQKPGKPFWFGSIENKYVFGLPGNPVSTYMCFHRYVLPWLRKSLGIELHQQYAILANDFTFQPHLTYFLQVKIKNVNGCWMAYPHSGQGSGDFANLTEIDGFLELPKEKQTFAAGSYFPVFMVR